MTKGSSEEDETSRLALGARFVVFDLGDPRLDEELSSCFSSKRGERAKVIDALQDELIAQQDAVREDAEREAKLERLETLHAQRIAELEQTIDSQYFGPCREASRKRNWNATALSFGVAGTWRSEQSGSLGDLQSGGFGAWVTQSYGFERWGVLANTSQRSRLFSRPPGGGTMSNSSLASSSLSPCPSGTGGRVRPYSDPLCERSIRRDVPGRKTTRRERFRWARVVEPL